MDKPPSDSRRFLLMALWATWLMAFVYGIVAAMIAPSEAGGPDLWLNKLAVFLEWQAVAGIVAVAIYGVGTAWEKRSVVRRWSRYPVLLALLQAVIFAAIAVSNRAI